MSHYCYICDSLQHIATETSARQNDYGCGLSACRMLAVLLTINVVVVYFERNGPKAAIAFGVDGPLLIAE